MKLPFISAAKRISSFGGCLAKNSPTFVWSVGLFAVRGVVHLQHDRRPGAQEHRGARREGHHAVPGAKPPIDDTGPLRAREQADAPSLAAVVGLVRPPVAPR